MAVDVDEQIALWTDGFAYRVGAGNSKLGELFDLRSVREIAGHVVEGRELDGVKPSSNGALGHTHKAFWCTWICGAVDVGVVANPGVQESAEQVISRDGSDFATDVPQALLEAAQRHGRSTGAALEDLGLGGLAQPLDVVNTAALEQI